MKKVIVMLVLVLSFFISQKAYSYGTIRKGNLLIYNKTPFSNATVLFYFNRFWHKYSTNQEKRSEEKLIYWTVVAKFKGGIHKFYSQSQQKWVKRNRCVTDVYTKLYLKPEYKNLIKGNFKQDDGYIIINNHKVDIYSNIPKTHNGHSYFAPNNNLQITFSAGRTNPFTNPNTNEPVRTCNHRFFQERKAKDRALKPELKVLDYAAWLSQSKFNILLGRLLAS